MNPGFRYAASGLLAEKHEMNIKRIFINIKRILWITMIVLGIACFIVFYQFVREFGKNSLINAISVSVENSSSQDLKIIEVVLNDEQQHKKRQASNFILGPRHNINLYKYFKDEPLRLTAKWISDEKEISAECVIDTPGSGCYYDAFITTSQLTCSNICVRF